MSKKLSFWKMTAGGNDFVVLDNRKKIFSSDSAMSSFTREVCQRRKSIGADGVLLVDPSPEPSKYDFRMRYLNADGGEVEMCGNGARCLSVFASENNIAGERMTFLTLAGPISSIVNGNSVKLLLSPPKGTKEDNPESMFFVKRFEKFPLLGKQVELFTANTGVPHTVMFVENLDEYPVNEHGAAIRYHEQFKPAGTNANFITVIKGENALHIRTYERGVEDETLACGTGSTAAALIANFALGLKSPVAVHTRGGIILRVMFENKGAKYSEVYLEGPGDKVYEGTYDWRE